MNGYIYLRTNNYFKLNNVFKLGHTANIPERNDTYITGELKRGYFIDVYQIFNFASKHVEKLLQLKFKNLNVYFDAGKEFFNIEIRNLIEPFFKKNNIRYRKLLNEEIEELTRNKKEIIPREYQKETLDKMIEYYLRYDNGKIIWSCGLGKTLLSLFFITKMEYKNICIGVPSVFLQNQFSKEIEKFFKKDVNIVKINGDISTIFLKNKINFIITTYTSCYLLKNLDFIFDLKIADEAHHLTTKKGEKSYSSFHDIKSKKSLFMTATEKFYENMDENYFSMDDQKYFGEIIDKKNIKWAIDNKKITDYYLVVLKTSEKELENIKVKLKITNEVDKNLLFSSYCALKSLQINGLKHILLYTNKIENSHKVIKYIDYLLKEESFNWSKEIKNIFRKSITSNDNKHEINNKLKNFTNNTLGIISCVYILGEGFNLPKLTAVLIAENMESEIRIVQSCLRANRLDPENPEKRSYIIIPTHEDIENENSMSFEKLKLIVKKFSEYDDIIQRLKIVNNAKNDSLEKSNNKIEIIDDIEINNITELKLLEIKLIKNKCLNSSLKCEEIEYQVLKLDNKKLNLQTDFDYKNSKDKRSYYIENPEEYFGKFELWKNWYHFLDIDTSNLINDKEIWYRKCKDLNINSKEEYLERCKENKTLPIMPSELFKDFQGFDLELKRNKLSYMF